MTTPSAPAGFYAQSAQATWGTVALTPIEAKSLIPGELQKGLALYNKLFPPPPPGSFWQNYGPIIESVAIFAVGAAALAAVGTAGAATAASTAATASTGTTTAATITSAGTATAAAGSSAAATSSLAAAYSALQTGAGYIAPVLGIAGKITGNTTAQKMANFATAFSQKGTKAKLTALTKNLAMSRLPANTQLSASDQAYMNRLITQQQMNYLNNMRSQSARLASSSYIQATPLNKNSNLKTWGIVGIAALLAAKVGGLL